MVGHTVSLFWRVVAGRDCLGTLGGVSRRSNTSGVGLASEEGAAATEYLGLSGVLAGMGMREVKGAARDCLRGLLAGEGCAIAGRREKRGFGFDCD